MYAGSFRNGKMVYGRLSPGEENSGKLVSMVRSKAKQLAKDNGIEIIILDGPPGIGCPVISTITGVDSVVIVTEPTISGLHDMQRTIEVIKKFNLKSGVIINKFDLNLDMSTQIDNWCISNGIEVIGHLPFDPQMVNAMVQGKTIIELDSDSAISTEIKRIWNHIKN